MHIRNPRHRGLSAFMTLALTCASAGYAYAAVITTVSSTAPSDHVLVSQTTEDTFPQWRNTTSIRDIGQTFKYADAFVLDSITIKASGSQTVKADVPVAAFSLDVYTFSSSVAVTPDALVSTQSGTLPASFASGDYLTFDIPNLSLSANQEYGFVLRFTASATNRILYLAATSTTSAYPSGVDLYYNGSSYAGYAGDLVFFINTVPEPASLLLMGCAGVVLMGGPARSHRRRHV